MTAAGGKHSRGIQAKNTHTECTLDREGGWGGNEERKTGMDKVDEAGGVCGGGTGQEGVQGFAAGRLRLDCHVGGTEGERGKQRVQ